MQRREFIAITTLLAALVPVGLRAETLEYTPGLVDDLLADGKTVFLDFKADWCTTCARQERVIGDLRSSNSDNDDAITFVDVDWDTYRQAEITQR